MHGSAGGGVRIAMSSPLIDQPPAIDRKATRKSSAYWRRRRKLIESAITITLTAACVLEMSETGTSTKRKNAKWDEDVEVFEMMEFLKGIASKAGEGGLFPEAQYNQAAAHIQQHKPKGTDAKTGAQVENKYTTVCSLAYRWSLSVLNTIVASKTIPAHH